MTDDRRARRAASFGAEVDAYERGRPGYPPAALRACLPRDAARVLDLGAGTGKLTRALLGLGLQVVAVEPLAAMRAAIPPAAEVLDVRAEQIPLPAASVDAVVVGQAFHWFDTGPALAEIARVLRPRGTLGVLWNGFDDRVPWVAAVADVFGSEDRASLLRGRRAPWTGAPGLSDPELLTFPHIQPADADLLVDNIASRSVVITAERPRREELLRRVRALAPPGRFDLPHVCHLWHARRVGPPDGASGRRD